VKTYGDISKWIQNSYQAELKKAGAQSCDSPDKIVISGVIKDVHQEEAWDINSKLRVIVNVKGKQFNFAELFEGQSSQVSHAASESEFTDSLYKAVEDLMKKSIPVVVSKAQIAERLAE